MIPKSSRWLLGCGIGCAVVIVRYRPERLRDRSALADFYTARNRALMDVHMGLGEYTYIYVLAYHAGAWGAAAGRGAPSGRTALDDRTREAFLKALDSRLTRLKKQAAEPEEIRALEAEIHALEEDPERIPWRDGLPTAIAGSLEPYRERLEALYCAAAAEFALSRSQRRGVIHLE